MMPMVTGGDPLTLSPHTLSQCPASSGGATPQVTICWDIHLDTCDSRSANFLGPRPFQRKPSLLASMPRKQEVQNSPWHILPGAHPSLSVHKPHQLLKINLVWPAVQEKGFTAPEAPGSAQQLVPCPQGSRPPDSGSNLICLPQHSRGSTVNKVRLPQTFTPAHTINRVTPYLTVTFISR